MQAQDQFKPGIGVNILSLFKLKRQNFSECRKMLCKAYIEFVNCTARVERVGEMVIDRLAIRGFRSILVSWRCHWPIGLWLLAGRDIYAQSGMGNILENVLLSKFGWDTLPRLYSQDSLMQLKELLNSGRNVALTADSPFGPYRQVQPAPLFLAERSGQPIVPFAAAARPGIYSRNRTGLLYPLPFARVVLYFGPPVWIESGPDVEIFRRNRDALEKSLVAAESGAAAVLKT